MNLVIVESPTKAKTIEKFLGKDFKVVASYGHVIDLPKKELGIDTKCDFEPTLEVTPRGKKTLAGIKKLAKSAKDIYIATDPDREGEAIGYHIAKNIFGQNSKLEIGNSKLRRVVFHEITKDAIKESFKNSKDMDLALVSAQTARRVLDRLVGYKLSPLLWKKVRYGLSAGRVQSVAVRLIVERERQRKAFKMEEYWEISATFASDIKAGLKKINGKAVKILNEKEAKSHVSNIKNYNHKIYKIEKKEVKKNPHPPFITSTLQQATGNLFGFSAKRTMIAAQKLYERGFITYHRTDSFNLSPSFIDSVRKYINDKYGRKYLTDKPRVYKRKSKNAQEAHEAIRPTDVANKIGKIKSSKKENIADQQKLYDLIWKRAVASQLSSSVYERVTVDIESKSSSLSASENNLYLFRSVDQVVKFEGYLKVYGESKEKTVLESPAILGSSLLKLKEEDSLKLLDILPSCHFTQPPARYSTASLIKRLEEEGIGRPSTYASIISTIESRGYVLKDGKYFYPDDVAYIVNDLLVSNFPVVTSYQFTAQIEDKLDDIAQGKTKWNPVIRDFYIPFAKKLAFAEKNLKKTDMTTLKNTGKKCPECKSDLVVKLGRFGKFISCSGFPKCKYMEAFIEKIGKKCPVCGDGDILIRRTKKGKIFYGCSNYPSCNWASWKKP